MTTQLKQRKEKKKLNYVHIKTVSSACRVDEDLVHFSVSVSQEHVRKTHFQHVLTQERRLLHYLQPKE